jgi:hypothetical protein
MTIRVTPIGGGPVELPEDTPCIACIPRYAELASIIVHECDGEYATVEPMPGVLDQRAQLELGAVCDDGATRAFIRIGDAWPFCTIETWRQRAERLEQGLEAERAASRAPEQRCPECDGALAMSRGPGRARRYRGADGYEVPADLSFPVCTSCGAEWLTDSQLETLSAAFEDQRERRTL